MKSHNMISMAQKTARTLMVLALIMPMVGHAAPGDRIQPWPENPFYWQYKGEPVLLIGGSDQDNLFNHPDSLKPEGLESHLDLLVSVGGNYVRNTMSDRDPENRHAFARRDDGLFDLNNWDEAYWTRFDHFLRMCYERDIIVQIELFDMHDLIQPALWNASPWNPDRNVNYTFENTRLPRRPTGTVYRNGESVGSPHEFLHSVPAVNNDSVLLDFQQRFVDRVLQHTLRYDNVLYCISNEIHTEYSPEWGWYWAGYLRQRADKAGKRIDVAEMFWAPELNHQAHRDALDRPEVFTFFEASQNSVQSGQTNWDQLHFVREHLRQQPRPINNTKVYGADTGPVWAGNDRHATERFWRNLIGGSASSRFHRPPTGLGLGDIAQRHIRSARMLTDEMNVFACAPQNDLLGERSLNEAYCLAEPGKQYAVYFPNGGDVTLDVTDVKGALQVRWLDIDRGTWQQVRSVQGGGMLNLKTPGPGHWAVLAHPKRVGARKSTMDRIRPWLDNQHYLAWDDTPVFPLSATGYFNPLTLCTDPHFDFVDIAQGVSGHEFGAAQDQALGGGRRIAAYRQAMRETGTLSR